MPIRALRGQKQLNPFPLIRSPLILRSSTSKRSMIVELQPNLYQLRSFLVSSYLIIDDNQVYLINGGFLGGLNLIERCLHSKGLDWSNITTVLLTHGHLDHTFNLAQILKRSGATLYAHPLDSDHIAARHRYRGLSRGCWFLEFSGRLLFGYQVPNNYNELRDGQSIDNAGGIHVLHTPGHTAGHCSFFWPKRNILFTGDLFATGRKRTFLPPSFLNSCPQHLPTSIAKALALNPAGMLSNHCDKANAFVQAERFRREFG